MATAKQWNPMEDAYKNKNFNKYEEGPGADLDENMQPGAMASGKTGTDIRFQLCLKSVPTDMTEKAIWNLCANYGKVTYVGKTPKTPYVFVTFATLNDMERALEGLKTESPEGIFADISKQTADSLQIGQKQTPSNSSHGSSNFQGGGQRSDRNRDRHSDTTDSNNQQIDLSRRTIKGPFTNPPRKNFGEHRKPFVTEDDYKNSALKDADPDRHFLVERDMHEADRNNIRANQRDNQQGGKHMHTGRAYYKDSKDTTENLQKLSMASQGSYNAEKDEFIKNSQTFEAEVATIQNCVLCKKIALKICQRCGDFYCSLDCQRQDWSRHRMFCFPMPELIAPVNVRHTVSANAPMAMQTLNGAIEDRNDKVRTASQSSDSRDEQSRSHQFNNALQHNGDGDSYNQRNQGRGQNRDQGREHTRNQGREQGKTHNNDEGFDQGRGQGRNQGRDHGRDSGRNSFDNKKDFNSYDKKEYNKNSSFESNKKDQGRNASFENKKDQTKNFSFENKKDQERNASFEKKKDQGKNFSFENKKDQGKSSSSFGTAPNKQENVPKAIESLPKPPQKIECGEIPKTGSVVAITAVMKPNKLYIRSLESAENVQFVKLVNLVNNEAKNAKQLEKMPQRGDFAVTDFQGEGFFRVCIINPESADKIRVAYIDFGNVDIKKLSELRELPAQVAGLKRQTFPFILKGVGDFDPIPKITEYLNSYVDAVGKELRLVYDTENGKSIEGELIDIATNECLNKKVNEMRNIKVPSLNDIPVFMTDIEVNLIPAGENVTLVVLDTSLVNTGIISCIHKSDLLTIDKLTSQFSEYAKKTTGPYTPRTNEVCLVQYEDDCWYRAECLDVVGDQNPSVSFIDFGNATTVHISKIRRYPKDLIAPCVTIPCWIGDISETDLNEKLEKRLKELIPMNEEITAKKIEIVDNENIIYLPDVLATLKAEKLLT